MLKKNYRNILDNQYNVLNWLLSLFDPLTLAFYSNSVFSIRLLCIYSSSLYLSDPLIALFQFVYSISCFLYKKTKHLLCVLH